MSKKELLFSVTAADCEWSYTKGSGNGGQKKNKTSSAVHCMHRPSGAHGYSEASRSQHDNKKEAFVKMVESSEFKRWHQREVWRRLGVLDEIDRAVEQGMQPHNLKLEIKVDGKWTPVPFDMPLDIDTENMTVSAQQ
jgi:protein subunit release factor B